MARDDTTATGRTHEPSEEAPPPLHWKLRVVYAAGKGIVQAAAKPVRGPAPLMIGRGTGAAAAGRRLFLDDARASRDHARVSVQGLCAVLEDLGSKNGTEVNGQRLRPGQPCALTDGDVLRLGDSFLLVHHELGTVPDASIPSLVGVSQAACKLRSTIGRCALADVPVLLLGETGTGKGAAAAAMHALSGRAGKLVAVNCAAIPVTLAESLFFGVHGGAYTGAVAHAGCLEEAHGGTLFLDEVGELPSEIQAKLLHAIEAQQITPLGSNRSIACTTHIVAATNRDLAAGLRAGSFREDLYHRLAAVMLRMPPLRERREDLLLLAAHLAREPFAPSPALVAAMLRYPWPGNVRELANLTARVRVLSESDVITGLLSPPTTEQPGRPLPAAAAPSLPPPLKSDDARPTREEVVALLMRYRGSLRRIEMEAGYSRRQFRRWADRYGIDPGDYRPKSE